MNAWGQVVFEAFTTVGVDTIQELRVGRGDSVGGVPTSHVVAKGGQNFQGPLAPFGSLEEGAIDDTARVTFLAYVPSSTGGGQGIYRVFTDHPATVKPDPLFADQNIDPLSPYLGFDPLHTLRATRPDRSCSKASRIPQWPTSATASKSRATTATASRS